MNISRLKSSTAAVLCLSLMQPLPVLAQTSLEGVAEVTGADELVQAAEELTEEAQKAADEAAAAAEAQAAAEKAATDEAAAAAEAQAAAEKAAADEAAAAAEAQAAAENAAADEAAAAAEAQAAAENAAADEAAAAAEAQAAAEKAATDEAAAAAEAQAAAEKAAADEAAAAAEAQAAAEKAAADEAAAAAEAQAAAETTDADEATAAAEAQAAAEETGAEQTTADDASTETQSAGEADGEQLTDAERQERAQQREAQSAAAAEATAESEAAAEVETQTVNESDVRRSSEDFDTSVTGEPEAATAAAPAPSGDDGGLSNFEKALLLGLGAAVVGTVLANGDKVRSNSGDRVVVERDGELRVLKNDDELLRRPGAEVSTQTFNDGSTRSTLSYDDGSQIITVRASDGTVLRRTLIRASDGAEVVLFDDTQAAEPIDFDRLPTVETIASRQSGNVALDDEAELQRALQEVMLADVDRRFSLRQVRDYKRVRALAPQIELDAVTFATGSAAIQPSEAQALADLGGTMRRMIEENPRVVFLIEGHTDAVGGAGYNLALSDRRAETVALALTEYFDVPPQNLITQGYGESDLKVSTLVAERANRRAAVRNITGLLD
ncbi:OmpA family protein [Roseovarius pelagicus]|uniref:OmpA family protein n=1 Tax=Roseovarius pelagicus TaxID=2980108 RepID=A0ABY6DD04_9RHOB|nr:OmpA family protein [Roseovarius pelagicus]UXX81710.1 OmpA family protein [Roseovarius pelagicus]